MKKYLTGPILIGLLCSQPFLAFAHAHIKESTPAKDAIVNVAPQEVSIKFSEDLEASMSKLEVKNIKTGDVVSEATTQIGEDKASLKAALKNIKNEKSTYQVSWKAVSKDGHTMKGSYDFTLDPKVK